MKPHCGNLFIPELLGIPNINDVYWTLCLEVQFYLIFCGLLAIVHTLTARGLSSARTIVFLPAFILAMLCPMEILHFAGRATVFLPLWYSFLLGVLCYWAWTRVVPVVTLYSYSAILLAVGIVQHNGFALGSVATALLLYQVAQADLMQRWLNWSWLQRLGRVSYSLYLTHTPVLGLVFFLGQKVWGVSLLSNILCLGLGIAACVGFATGMWTAVEQPSIVWSQKLKGSRSLPMTA